ncbi:MAG TPA: VWA domain-containing protein [Opitutaceae bacterium]|nr:VWA domain-containing protein [Opitutaceae bacterium]
MSFYWPHLLWLLVPVAALAVWDGIRRAAGDAAHGRPKILRAWAGARQAEVGSGRHNTRGRLLLWLGLAFGVVALARPQWGQVEEPVFDQSREIIIALDLSRSMLATDVRPSRLERARLLIQGLLDGLRGERVGLVVFSGTAFLQVPLSADYEVLNEFLPSLNPQFMPVGGTNYGAMLRAALDAFGASGSADRYLIVLSDGEALDPDWRDNLDDLRKKNIRVIGLGVGTAQGSLIPDGAGGFVKDARGAVVFSKLNSSTLQELAKATNGVYTDASAWVDLSALLQRTIAAGHKGQFEDRRQVRQIERFQWALAPAMLCLLLSLWREFPVRPRVRSLPLAASGAPKSQAPSSKSQAGIAAAALILALLSGIPNPKSARAAEDTSAYAAPLSKLVERLSEQPALAAGDCASLAQETLTWGRRLQEARQPVMPGPVNDALAGVTLGEKLNPKAADWPHLRSDLGELLKEPPKPPPQQQQNQQQQQPQDQQQQDQAQQPQTQNSEPKTQNQAQPPPPPPKPREQANTGENQRIGGQPPQNEKINPSLALPLQKLDQLRNQDSPAELFQMLDSRDRKPPPKAGPDW